MKTLTIKSSSKEFTDEVLQCAYRADRTSAYYDSKGIKAVNGRFLTAIARKAEGYYEIEITTRSEYDFDLKEIFEQFI